VLLQRCGLTLHLATLIARNAGTPSLNLDVALPFPEVLRQCEDRCAHLDGIRTSQ
jgi:hypothetical protein